MSASYNQSDADGDGFSTCADDCNDSDAYVYPGAAYLDSTTECMRDFDGDGYGDEADGNEPDACPTIRGTSILDRFGCRDTDGDGWSDPTDDWDAHPYGSRPFKRQNYINKCL